MNIMKRVFVLSMIIISLIFSSLPSNITVEAKGGFSKISDNIHPKLGPSLNGAFNNKSAAIKGIEPVKKNTEKLHVYIEFDHPSIKEAVSNQGEIKNISDEYQLIEAVLPAGAIAGLLNNPHVLSVKEVMKPMVQRGYTMTEGFYDVGGQGISTYLKLNGKAGDGMKIGVISDGVDGLATAISYGEIPQNVTILNNRVGGAEGTAMLEIVHDLAPNAQLYFHDCGNSSLDFIEAINALAAAGVDIIIDDIVYLDEPFFEDSIIAKHINQLVTSTGLLYVSAAGNHALGHVQSLYRPTLRGSVYEHDFTTTLSGVQRMEITIEPNASVIVMLQWNEPFKNSSKDIELAVCSDNSTQYCFVSENYQQGSGYDPLEYLELVNTTGAPLKQYVTVYSTTPYSNVTFEIYLFGNASVSKYGTRTDSTFGHSTAANVISVAAVNSEMMSIVSPYSSQGPFTMVNGTTRNKPDFTGVDCVSVSGAGGFGREFCGTSAASPHIGAIAALMWSNNRTLTRAQLIDAMKAKAVDIYTTGFDYQSGHGLIHLGVYSNEITIPKNEFFDYTFVFDKPGNFTADSTSILSVTSTLQQSININGVTYYQYSVRLKGLIDGSTILRFTATDSTVLMRQKIAVSLRMLDFFFDDDRTIYIQNGKSAKLTVLPYPSNANNASFTYSTSNSAVATVDSSGNITAKTTGSVQITVRHNATNMFLTQTVKTGIMTTGLAISPSKGSVYIGESMQLSAVFTPSNATYKTVTWSTNNDCASIDANGRLTGLRGCSVLVNAQSADGAIGSATITVIEPLVSISFTQEKYSFYYAGKTFTRDLLLNRQPSTSNEPNLIWQSSNPDVIETDNTGKLTIKGAGDAIITVSGPNQVSAQTEVSVQLQPYTIPVTVERNGKVTPAAYSIKALYGDQLTIDQLKELYHQAMVLPAGAEVFFYRKLSTDLFGITDTLTIDKDMYLQAIEMPILATSLRITQVSAENNILSVSGAFTPDRPFDIRYRYRVSDPTVLRVITAEGNADCSQPLEFGCASGSFEILSAGFVTLILETYDGKISDTIRLKISRESDQYVIDQTLVQSLTVTPMNSTTLKLNWSAVNMAAGYEVFRGLSTDGAYEKIADVSAAEALQVSDGLRMLNQPNYYKVRPYFMVDDQKVFGDFSEVMMGKTRPDTLNNVTVKSLDFNMAGLKIPFDSKISTVIWSYSTLPNGPFISLAESPNLEQTVTRLAPTTYYFKVRYSVDTAFGRVFSEDTALIEVSLVPSTPEFTVTPLSVSDIDIIIKKEYTANYFYQFFSVIDGVETLIHESTFFRYTFTGARPGKEYAFKVREAVEFDGKLVFSAFTPLTTVKVAPEPVKNIVPLAVGINSISLSWDASPYADGYEVSQSFSSSSGFTVVADITQTSYKATSLKFNTSYYFRVRPYVIVNQVKVYGAYGSSSATNGYTQVPYVENLTVKDIAYNANRIEWSPVEAASGYEIYYSKGTSTSYVLLRSQTTVGYTHSSLITNTKYNYKIRAYYLVGTTKVYGSFGLSSSATPLTAAPNATVTSTGYNSLRVSWPAVAGASGYEVSYSLSENGTYTKLPLTTSLSVNISNTPTDRTVYVKVRAYRTVNYVKIYGHSVSVTGKSVCSAPKLTLVSGGYDSIRTSWTSVAGANGYQLYVLVGSTYKLLTDTTALSYTDTGKITGQEVTYKAVAYRLVDGVKVLGDPAVSVAKALPAAATDGKVSASNVFALTLTCSAVSGATGYEISQSTSSAGTYSVVGDVSATTFTKSSLAFNTLYYYKIRAYRTVGSVKHYGPYSSVFSGRTALLPVSGISSQYTNYNTNSVTWLPVEGAAGYAIYYSTGTSTSFSLIKYQTATTLIHTGLTTNTKVNYKVRAYRMVGTTRVFGPYSTVTSSTPLPLAPVITVTSAGYNSLSVRWPAVAGATGYEVSYSLSATGPFTNLPLVKTTGATVTNVPTNVLVYVRVRTYRYVNYANRFGKYSEIVSAVAVPSAPTVTLSSPGYDSLKVGWAAVPGASGYEVYVLDGEYRLLQDTAQLSIVHSGLITGAETTFKVRAYRVVNNLKVFGPETVAKGKAVPAIASGFKVSWVDITSLSLIWNAVEGASGYEISQATSSAGTYSVVGDVSLTEFKKTGLTFNRVYYYKIRSYTLVDGVKVFGSHSAVISGKTVPSPVVLTVTPEPARTNALSWEPVNGANGYQIYYSTGTSTSYTLLATVTTTSYSHKALVAGRRYNYRVRAYRMSGTTRIYGDYSVLISGIAIN